MKLYYFNPNNYGQVFFVMEETITNAHNALLAHLKKEIVRNPASIYHKELLEDWKKANPLDVTTLPEEYTIDEHEIGEVIQSEIA